MVHPLFILILQPFLAIRLSCVRNGIIFLQELLLLLCTFARLRRQREGPKIGVCTPSFGQGTVVNNDNTEDHNECNDNHI